MVPLIGVSSGRRMVTSTKGETRATVLYSTYTNMIRQAGGIPAILSPAQADEAPAVLSRLDGLLLTGGGDVDPSAYEGSAVETLYGVDPLRDEYELALATAAREMGLPTLAICRGMQIANVAFGGTLIEDILTEDPKALQHRIEGAGTTTPQHVVSVVEGSEIASIIGDDGAKVNTIHHQALRDVASCFRVVATAPDGIVEAIESAEDWPMWGVQWHPEYLGAEDPPSLALFRTLVDASAG